MTSKFVPLVIGTAALVLGAVPAMAGRDQVKVAGSSTVLPYATIVAEEFGKLGKFKAPVVEGGGTGAGIKQFCAGVGEDKIDVANASRAIKPEERADCEKAGVKEIVEIKFGYDGIVFASDAKAPEFKLTPKDVFTALALQIVKDGKLVDNPNKTLKDVNADWPEWPIAFFVPGEKHGTREVFEQKVLQAGCKDSGARAEIEKANAGADKGAVDKLCSKMRKDGAAVDIDGDYTETLARLQSNKQSVGVFGLSFYESNKDKLHVATVNGVAPSAATVAKGEYPVSRPLFFYAKKAHTGVIPGLKEYVSFFVSPKIAGAKGPLVKAGLVPLPDAELKAAEAAAKALVVMK
jgi:phosphate transport system substrate-binding protein